MGVQLSPSCSFSCYVEEIAKMVSTVHMAVLALVSLVGVGAFKGEVPKCYELANSGGPIEKNLDVQLIIDNTNAAALNKLKTMLTTKFANDFVMPNTRFALTTIGTTQQVFSLEKGKTLTLFKTSVASISKGAGPLNGQVVQAMSKAYSEYQKEMRKHALRSPTAASPYPVGRHPACLPPRFSPHDPPSPGHCRLLWRGNGSLRTVSPPRGAWQSIHASVAEGTKMSSTLTRRCRRLRFSPPTI